jgi:hypothetical protein
VSRIWAMLFIIAFSSSVSAHATPTPTPPPVGTLLSQGKPAIASSYENATAYPASAAVDGNASTRWSSAFADPQWITVDLGAVLSLTQVRLSWEAAYASAYQIQISNDNLTWTTAQNVTAGHGGLEVWTVSASARYVRMYGTARGTAYGYSLWEMEVYGSAGGATPTARPTATATARATPTSTARPVVALLSRGKAATASSYEDALAYAAGNAVDGNTTTRWASAWADPQWITVDLGATASISQVQLNWEAAYASAYQLQTSTDNVAWTTIQNVTGHGGLEVLNVSGSGRYVRMYGSARATTYGYSLWEFEVYGTTTGATPTATPRTTATARPTATATIAPTATSAPHALILIDQRLYAYVATLVDQYRSLAAARRGFDISLRVVNGLDDWRFDQVKSYIVTERNGNPLLEGVLFVGNIKLPSFYKSRNDSNFTRLLPRYYEDLDGVFAKHNPDGSTDPACTDPTDPNCFIYGPSTIGVHDFDYTDKGPNPDPEIWTSYMPVGSASGANSYSDFANQLTPYLQKLVRYYNHQIPTNGKYYFVTGDKGETFDITWDAFTKYNIDLYGKPGPNGETGSMCLTPSGNVCYQRWPIETYPDAPTFINAYNQLWVGEGWQQDTIFLSHMNATAYQVVEVNTHADETWSVVSSDQARTITRGGLLVGLDGCSVAGFRQPGSPSTVDTAFYPDANLAVAYVYGSSNAVAVMGDPFWRGHYAHYPTIYRELRLYGSYLGRAHLVRMKKQYALSTTPWDLRENGMEMVLGDPFMDLNP